MNWCVSIDPWCVSVHLWCLSVDPWFLLASTAVSRSAWYRPLASLHTPHAVKQGKTSSSIKVRNPVPEHCRTFMIMCNVDHYVKT